MEYCTRDSYLAVSEDGTVYKELYGLSGFPQMGGTPNKIDVTNLRDKRKRYINGVQETEDLSFPFYYNREKSGDSGEGENKIRESYKVLREYQNKDTLLHWKLVYSDGSGFKWDGRVSVFRDSGEVNAALKFTANISCETELTDFEEATT